MHCVPHHRVEHPLLTGVFLQIIVNLMKTKYTQRKLMQTIAHGGQLIPREILVRDERALGGKSWVSNYSEIISDLWYIYILTA